MRTSTIGRLVIIMILLSLTLGAKSLKAQDYPKKPVSMIVTSAAGGTVDVAARTLIEAAKPFFPQPIIVVNKPGGGGVIAASALISSPPDGYTIAALTLHSVTLSTEVNKVPYTLSDIVPITGIIDMTSFFIVNANASWKTMKEVLDYAKANPGKIRVSSPGQIGTSMHLLFEDMRLKTQVDMTYVPFTGGAGGAITALLGGHVEATIMGGSVPMTQVKAGTLRNLAAFAEERLPEFPNIPTFRELGYDLFKVNTYYFIAAPKGTSQDIVQTLYGAFSKALKTDKFQKFALDSVSRVIPWSPNDLSKRLESEDVYLKELLKKVKLQ